jgi:hypothetical protein
MCSFSIGGGIVAFYRMADLINNEKYQVTIRSCSEEWALSISLNIRRKILIFRFLCFAFWIRKCN